MIQTVPEISCPSCGQVHPKGGFWQECECGALVNAAAAETEKLIERWPDTYGIDPSALVPVSYPIRKATCRKCGKVGTINALEFARAERPIHRGECGGIIDAAPLGMCDGSPLLCRVIDGCPVCTKGE